MRLTLLLAIPIAAFAQFPQTGPPSKYEANWESIRRHPLPKWFDDAKLGIFVHWGIYSVPAWAPPSGELGKVDFNKWFTINPYAEWYLNTILIPDSPSQKHHREKYGVNFDYLDFVPEFNRETKKWNPQAWAELFRNSGARYVVLTTKHHDGFTLWPSKVPNPNRPATRQGSERDLVGELAQAVRGQGMKMGLYYSGGLDWSFQPGPIRTMGDLMKNVPQSDEYARYADAQWRELIARYQPDVLWNDINYPRKGDLTGIFSEYFNTVKDGLVNNRFGNVFSDFTTPEYARYDKITPQKWESCRGLGFSFGYNQAEGVQHVLPADELIDMFVDIVSKNGNLLLNVGPKPDGTIPQMQVERLNALGEWLTVNAEGIFESKPWHRATSKTSDGGRVRFTRKGETVYAFLLDTPKSNQVIIESVFGTPGMKIDLLGSKEAVTWTQSGKDLVVTLPAARGESFAHTLKMSPMPWQAVRE